VAQFDVTAVFKITGLKELNKAFKQISSSAKNVGKNFKKFSSDATRFATNITRVGVAAGAALAGAAVSFAKFEDDFTNVVTLLDDGSFAVGSLEDGVEGLKKGITDLSQETGETFENLNKGLFDLISAGVDAADAITTLGIATELAIAGGTDTAIAVDGLTSALGAFGDEAGTAEEISQKFFTAQKFGKTTIEELAGSVGLVASQAKAAGISFEELLATVSASTAAGIRTKAAFTGLRGAIDNIQKPTAAAREEAERLGISFDAQALRAKGLTGVLQDAANSANFTTESFVKLFGSVEARNFALAVANDNFSKATNILGELNDKTQLATTFSDALEEKQGTLAFATNRLRQTFKVLVKDIGESVGPALIEFFNLISDLIKKFNKPIVNFFKSIGDSALEFVQKLRANFPQLVEEIRTKFTQFVDAAKLFFNSIKEVFNFIAPIVKSVLGFLDALAKALGLGSGLTLAFIAAIFQFSGAFRLLGSSALLVISIIRLLVTIISTTLLPIIVRIGAVIIGFGAGLVTTAGSVGILGTALGALRIALLGLGLVGIAIAIGVLIDQTIGWEKALQILKDVATAVFNFFVTQLTNIGKGFLAIIQIVAQVAAAIVEIFSPGLGAQMSEGIRLAFTKLGEDIKRIFTRTVDFLKGLFNGFINFFKRATDVAKKTSDNLKKQTEEIAAIKPKPGSILDPNARNRSVSPQELAALRVSGFAGNFSKGGSVHGPGTGTSDSIMAKLSRGEYVVKASSVKKLGVGFMNSINNGILPVMRGFADGGLVDALNSSIGLSSPSLRPIAVSSGSIGTSGRPITLVLPGGESFDVTATESTAQRLQRELRGNDMRQSANKPGWIK